MQNYSYENDFGLHENKTECRTHFHMNGFALRLVLKQRHKITRKWLIEYSDPLTHRLQCAGRDKHWPLFLLETSSPLTKIGIICTQVLQEEKIFLVIPRSEICTKMLGHLTEKLRAKSPW